MFFKKIIFVLAFTTIAAEEPLNFKGLVENIEGFSHSRVTNFLHSSEAQKLCDNCWELRVEVRFWHDLVCDKDLWEHIRKYFFDLGTIWEQKGQHCSQVTDLLGEPFKTAIKSYADDNGIDDDFDIEYDLENPQTFSLIINVTRGLTSKSGAYDKNAWQKVFNAFLVFAQNFIPAANPEDLLAHCCPMLKEEINAFYKNSGVYFSIGVEMEDEDTNTLTLEYKPVRPAPIKMICSYNKDRIHDFSCSVQTMQNGIEQISLY